LAADVLEGIVAKQNTERIPDSFAYKLAHVLGVLARDPDMEQTRMARLEWAYLPATTHHWRRPALLLRELDRNPEFFVDLVCWVFKAENEDPRTPSDEEQQRARHAFELLECWRTVPGSADGGEIDTVVLNDWIRRARSGLTEKGRLRVGDERIGHALSGSPHGQDGAWPHEAVRAVIESVQSTDLEQGIALGVYNSRGVVTRAIAEGGRQERELCDQYEEHAAKVGTRWPRTAALLRRIAAEYGREALSEDQRAELEDGLE
jgi:hypothetical protein